MNVLLFVLPAFLLIQSKPIMPKLVSAQVVLKPAKQPDDSSPTAITTATIAAYQPAPESISLATRELAKLGFDVGHVVGNNFSITAPPETFKKVFNVTLSPDKKGIKSKRSDGTLTSSLPVRALPQPVADHIQAIALPEAPDFGPGSY